MEGQTLRNKSTLFILYIVGFLFAFTSSIPAYVNSSFLKNLTNEQFVGFFYTSGSILSLIALILLPKILKKYGNYKVTVIFSILYFLNFLSLAFSPNFFEIVFSFILSSALATLIYFNLDIFIEYNSTDSHTGGIRGIYLTCLNLAWLVSPWLSGLIAGVSSYRNVYIVVSLILIPIILIIFSSMSNFKDPEYKYVSIFETINVVKQNKNIENIWFSSFLLQMFYSWMIIYVPIYLNQYIGFDWGSIGIIFSIALLPFVLTESFLGYIADKRFGEKEILTLGFIILAISTAFIPLITDKSIFIWSIALFMTRVGAAMVEVMNDTYFFKNVEASNINLINFYRTSSPFAYIISPLIASIILIFLPLNNIFYILGLFMILGLRYSLTIKDTK